MEADKKKKDKNDDPSDGKARGRPEAELQGTVAGKAGTCPTITFTVNGISVRANGVTKFEGTTCATLANGNLVKVEGQPLGDGAVLAREVKLLAGAAPIAAVSGATVALFQGSTIVATRVTKPNGEFEFEDVAPGTYDLKATQLNSSTPCAPGASLATGVLLVARRNEVEGKLVTTASPTLCSTLVLAKLEVKQGNPD